MNTYSHLLTCTDETNKEFFNHSFIVEIIAGNYKSITSVKVRHAAPASEFKKLFTITPERGEALRTGETYLDRSLLIIHEYITSLVCESESARDAIQEFLKYNDYEPRAGEYDLLGADYSDTKLWAVTALDMLLNYTCTGLECALTEHLNTPELRIYSPLLDMLYKVLDGNFDTVAYKTFSN